MIVARIMIPALIVKTNCDHDQHVHPRAPTGPRELRRHGPASGVALVLLVTLVLGSGCVYGRGCVRPCTCVRARLLALIRGSI